MPDPVILGVSGSPVKGGNVDALLKDALSGREHEITRLSSLEISDCRQCNWCLTKQAPDRYCSLEDDMRGKSGEGSRSGGW